MATKDKLINLEDLKVLSDHVEGEVTDLKSDLSSIELTFTDGGLVNQANYISSNANYSYSSYIDVIPGEKIHLLSYFSGDAKAVFTGTDKTDVKQYISSAQNLYDNVITVPSDARYFRFSCITQYKSRVRVNRVVADEFEILNGLYYESKENFAELFADVDDINGIFGFDEVELTFSNDYYVNSSGTKSTNWGGHSQFIELKAGETLRAYVKGSGTVVALIATAKTNTATTFTPQVVSQNSNAVTVEYIATENCYAILSSNYSSITPKAWIYIDIGHLNDRVATLEGGQNPLDTIVKAGGALSLFPNIGCIGDSLSVGETYSNQGGSWQVHSPNYPISWPQRLAKMCGLTAYNFGRGGQTSKTWMAEWANNVDFTGHVCEAYIIALGINDAQTYDQSTHLDVGTSSDIGTENDTFYRYYSDIISTIKTLQSKAKIFVVTMPTGLTTRSAYNVAIKYMATAFTNVYVIDLEQYASLYSQLTGSTAYWRNGHGNAMMYQISAWHINSYIDWIVRNNPNEFNQVEYIGTDYSYNQ